MTANELKERYSMLYDYVRMAMQDRSSDEILQALQRQSAQLDDLSRRQQTFGEDVASNVAGNAVWYGAVWLVRRLARLV